MSSEEAFQDYIRVIYGWKNVYSADIAQIALEHNLLKIGTIDKSRIQTWLNNTENDEAFNLVFNSGLMGRLQKNNEKRTWVVYNYSWYGEGEYFGLSIPLFSVGRFGEPRFGSLTINEIPLENVLHLIHANKDMIKLLTEKLGSKPSLITFSKEY